MDTDLFRYTLPSCAVAQQPSEPRDAARLLDTTRMADHRFSELPRLLRPGDVLVVNDTRVRAARLTGRRQGSGGEVEVLLLERLDGEHWEAMLRPARRLRKGVSILLGPLRAELMQDPEAGIARIRLEAETGEPEEVVETVGSVPLPPYFTGRLADPGRYQTVYAGRLGSAAAPTAGLHFTVELLDRVRTAGVTVASIDLEVGVDTFRPMATRVIEEHRMHSEPFAVPEATVAAIRAGRAAGGRVVAVGTTVVRALEAASTPDGTLRSGRARTDLFIRPGYVFRQVDAVVTNFHVPGSTLVVLVAAFMGERWRDAYAHALAAGYRFLSFGDAMYMERAS